MSMLNFLFLLSLLLISNLLSAKQIKQKQQIQEGTRVVFYVEHHSQQPEDYLEIKISIKSQQPSLDLAINQASNIVKNVEQIILSYCLTHYKPIKSSKSAAQQYCKSTYQTNKYTIKPIYQLVRKVPTFVAFSVEHETIAKIYHIKQIGKLADDILKCKVSKIQSFEWKPNEQVDIEQQAVTKGMQLINNLCDKVREGMVLDRILNVQEISQYDDKDEEEEDEKKKDKGQDKKEDQQEEEEEDDGTVVYRFEILCVQKLINTKNDKKKAKYA